MFFLIFANNLFLLKKMGLREGKKRISENHDHNVEKKKNLCEWRLPENIAQEGARNTNSYNLPHWSQKEAVLPSNRRIRMN